MLIVIDGYNFIFTVPELEKYVKVNDIETARDVLISLLARYKTSKRHNLILVFDSGHDCYCLPSRQGMDGLEIIYSRYSKDADTEIKEIINHCKNQKDTCVVTHDNEIRRYVQKKGSTVIDPKTFYEEITKVLGLHKGTSPKEPKSKYEGPSKDESAYWQKVFEDEKPGEEKGEGDATEDYPYPSKNKPQAERPSDGEPRSKYRGPSGDEVNYWLRFFNEGQEDDK